MTTITTEVTPEARATARRARALLTALHDVALALLALDLPEHLDVDQAAEMPMRLP